MKKIFNILTMAFMAVVVLSGCSKEDPFPASPSESGEGQVSMKKMLVEVTNEEEIVRSSIDVSQFIVTIGNANGTVGTYTYKDMPEIITLPTGDYTVSVKSHEVKNAAWEEPYFEGSQDFTIKANEITEVETVVCKLANVRVTIKYTEALLAVMGDDCKVNVLVGQNGSLDFVKSETRSGYFKYDEGSTTLVATFTGTVDNNYEENFQSYIDVAPGKHYMITYSLKSQSGEVPDLEGQVNFTGVNVDSTITDVDLTLNVDPEEDILEDDERPTEDPIVDPVTPATGPTVEAVAPITFDAPNVVDGSSTVQINVHSDAEGGIQEFKVIIISDILTPDELAAVGLTDVLDLVNPGQYKDALIGLGLPVEDEVKGQTDRLLDISQFMGLLGMLGSGSHDFKLTVGDANGTTTKTLTLVIE